LGFGNCSFHHIFLDKRNFSGKRLFQERRRFLQVNVWDSAAYYAFRIRWLARGGHLQLGRLKVYSGSPYRNDIFFAVKQKGEKQAWNLKDKNSQSFCALAKFFTPF
jgi:hypothetical protein